MTSTLSFAHAPPRWLPLCSPLCSLQHFRSAPLFDPFSAHLSAYLSDPFFAPGSTLITAHLSVSSVLPALPRALLCNVLPSLPPVLCVSFCNPLCASLYELFCTPSHLLLCSSRYALSSMPPRCSPLCSILTSAILSVLTPVLIPLCMISLLCKPFFVSKRDVHKSLFPCTLLC
jgi:hypothetical protein